jgi:hypothetical protein
MNKPRLNLLIDIVMTVLMAAVAGLGFLINWVLIPGEERPVVYGSRPDLYWLGLDRHDWGDVHLALGIALLALLVLHVALHWGQVVGIWRRMVASGVVRVVLALALLVLVIVLMVFPAFIQPEVVEDGHGEGRGRAQIGNGTPEVGTGADTPSEGPDGIGRGRGGSGRGLGRGRGGGGRGGR